ncbi:hypothetical protein [Nocardia sp. NBC_01009]|uniref:hypothetical protein n=1 Tax=Nocardia sp. NBC_01009 TaxID=2975996 RepID=UPI00386A9941|nr:hypothetical protein OHA42_08665 [Nocardia sp. NBC_01009]
MASYLDLLLHPAASEVAGSVLGLLRNIAHLLIGDSFLGFSTPDLGLGSSTGNGGLGSSTGNWFSGSSTGNWFNGSSTP